MMGSLDEMRTLKRNRRDTYRHPRRPSRKLGSEGPGECRAGQQFASVALVA